MSSRAANGGETGYLGCYAENLRDLAAQAPAECAETVEPIRSLADELDHRGS